MRFDEVCRLIQKFTGREIKQSDFVKILDIKRGTISARAKSNSEFPTSELIHLEQHFGFPMGSLSGVVHNDNNIELDFFPDVFGSCGDGSMVFEETSEKLAVTKDVITNYSDKNKYSVIVARGQSNEPTIMNNDKLIIQHITNNLIIDNQLYVFSYDGQIYIKRLIKNIDEIVIISDNPDKSVYRNQYVSKENMNDLKILGKVIGLLRENV